MGKRSYSGGTTALVIVLTLVVILIGVGFFFGMKIIGGGNELQHATDSGNLNVAKQALKTPSINFATIGEGSEFGDLTDPSNPTQIDLLAYDRMVGKSVLVALNAADEGTPAAATNAKTVYDLVQGQTGIGSRLATQLTQHSNLAGSFSSVSDKNSTRMLQNNGQITANASETAVAYMARSKASNVYISASQLPPNVQNFLANTSNVVLKNNKQYLAGYTALQCGLDNVKPYTVPMRPGEQPHLVDINDFQGSLQPPLGGNGSLIPPNAFRSGGTSVEGNQSGQTMTMRSCAVVGTLNQDFPISIPRGYIIVDNTGSMNFNGVTGGGSTALANALMQPSYIGLVPSAPGVGDMFGPPGTVEALSDYVNNPKNTGPVPSNLLSAISQPSGLTSDQAIAALKAPDGGHPPTVHQCNNINSISMGPGPQDPSCVNDYDKFLKYYGSQVGPTNTNAGSIMAVEAFKCYVLQVRSSVGSDGCGSAVAPKDCTGLKAYDINSTYCLPCNFAQPGTLGQLLGEAPNTASLLSQLQVRMHQIKPTVTDAEINCVMNSPVAFGQASYIYLQGGANGNMVLSSTAPSFPINATALPDGTAQTFSTGVVDLNGRIVNVSGCEGYENPWDCPALPANGENKVQWTPSSGYNNLMGVLKFMNCAGGGGDWCCPC